METKDTKSQLAHRHGREAESLAADWLIGQGLELVQKNYHCQPGEIDLVMQSKDMLVFVEVRYRSNPDFVNGLDSIVPQKKHRLRQAAWHYLQNNATPRTNARIDIVAIAPAPVPLSAPIVSLMLPAPIVPVSVNERHYQLIWLINAIDDN